MWYEDIEVNPKNIKLTYINAHIEKNWNELSIYPVSYEGNSKINPNNIERRK